MTIAHIYLSHSQWFVVVLCVRNCLHHSTNLNEELDNFIIQQSYWYQVTMDFFHLHHADSLQWSTNNHNSKLYLKLVLYQIPGRVVVQSLSVWQLVHIRNTCIYFQTKNWNIFWRQWVEIRTFCTVDLKDQMKKFV